MNKRILELRKQAMVREAYYPAGNDGHPEYRVYLNEEKFARLIVEECAKKGFEIFDEEPDAPCSDLQYYVRDGIKQHFGIL